MLTKICQIAVTATLLAALLPVHSGSAASDPIFPMVQFAMQAASPAAAGCYPGVTAHGNVQPDEDSDTLKLQVNGLPPFTAFDLYLTAQPNAPYGPAIPLSMLHSDAGGSAAAMVQTTLLQSAVVITSPEPLTHLVLFFDNLADSASCAALSSAPRLPEGARATGPALLATSGYPAAAGPLAAAPLSRPGLGVNSPSTGRSLPGQTVTFTTSCSDPAGWKAIRYIDLRLMTAGHLRFQARLDRLHRQIFVYDPVTGRWTGGASPGSSAVLITGLVQLKIIDSQVIATGLTTGKVLWQLTFTPPAHGLTFQQSVQVTDLRNQSSGWNPTGSWTVN